MGRDLCGIIDLVAITVDEPVVGIQALSLSNVSARVIVHPTGVEYTPKSPVFSAFSEMGAAKSAALSQEIDPELTDLIRAIITANPPEHVRAAIRALIEASGCFAGAPGGE